MSENKTLTEEGQEVADDLIHLVNVFDTDGTEQVVEKLSNAHRTIQQSFMREVVIPFLRNHAEKFETNNYDLRNETSVKWAYKLKTSNLLSDQDAYFPLV